MENKRKYLPMLVVMVFLWLQTTQVLLAQDTLNSEDSQSYHIYLPIVNSHTDVTPSGGEFPREATTTVDVDVVSSTEELLRDDNTIGTDTVQAAAVHNLYWTPWVSEENGGPPTYCQAWNEGAVGFGCRGNYCDDVRLLCETFPSGITLDSSTNRWTNFFSEEDNGIGTWTSAGWYPWDGSNYEVCNRTNTGGIVQGIRCSGSNCDNISLECSVPVRWVGGVRYPAKMTNCSWSKWYSEEQGSVDFGLNKYITGAKCSGSYCDNKQFYVCSLAP